MSTDTARSENHRQAALARWDNTTRADRMAATAAAKRASSVRNRAAHGLLRAAEDTITAAGGEIVWPT